MVSIICCTIRPSFMDNIFSNYESQDFRKKELIIVLNKDDMDINEWRKKASKYKNITVYQVPENYQLGKCLNYAIARAKYNIIAKFDDDDYYGPHYMKESLEALKKTKASVVGKYTSYIFFEEKSVLMLYRRGGERKYCRKVKGGTLVFKRTVWDKVKFDEVRESASDVDFLRRCRKMNFKIYSVSKHNYVCIRRENVSSHTHKLSTKKYMARCKWKCQTNNYIPIITKKL